MHNLLIECITQFHKSCLYNVYKYIVNENNKIIKKDLINIV